jgi:hypothetical protein
MNLALPLGRYYLRLLPPGEVIPISRVLSLRKISFGDDCLVSPHPGSEKFGRMLSHPKLARLLADEELGKWSMCPDTLNFLEQKIRDCRPCTILELGSGVSTICLAQYMHDTHGAASKIYVCSVEQDRKVIESVRDRLKTINLADNVQFFHAPLGKQEIAGYRTTCYDLPADLFTTVNDLRPDFIVIDGPAAEEGARFGTLPLVRDIVAPRSQFFLDDAFRDGELEIARRWAELPDVQIDGILPTEKGLLVGRTVEA